MVCRNVRCIYITNICFPIWDDDQYPILNGKICWMTWVPQNRPGTFTATSCTWNVKTIVSLASPPQNQPGEFSPVLEDGCAHKSGFCTVVRAKWLAPSRQMKITSWQVELPARHWGFGRFLDWQMEPGFTFTTMFLSYLQVAVERPIHQLSLGLPSCWLNPEFLSGISPWFFWIDD